jgi:hypothetical protein
MHLCFGTPGAALVTLYGKRISYFAYVVLKSCLLIYQKPYILEFSS